MVIQGAYALLLSLFAVVGFFAVGYLLLRVATRERKSVLATLAPKPQPMPEEGTPGTITIRPPKAKKTRYRRYTADDKRNALDALRTRHKNHENFDDIADRLGIPVGTLSSWLYHDNVAKAKAGQPVQTLTVSVD